MIGLLRSTGQDLAAIFTGVGHAPPPLEPAEVVPGLPDGLAALDCPDWLGPILQNDLGADFAPVLRRMQSRAPIFLRVNSLKGNVDAALEALAADNIAARPHPLAPTALEVTTNARRVQSSAAYLNGLVEVQDAASQAILADLPLKGRVLDYCAGGGGKALALAAAGARVWAHDADAGRMRDLPERAARAGVTIPILHKVTGLFDLVLLDVPCSGSGAWRRSPEGKWALTPEKLADLVRVQAGILDNATKLVVPGGHIAYATCSMLHAENLQQITAFMSRHPGWTLRHSRSLSPMDGGDGFFIALLTRDDPAI